MSDTPMTAAEALAKYQRQLDEDGDEVGVSRQAVHEVLCELAATRAELAAARERLTFDALAKINIQRCRRWHDPESWSPQMWGLAAAGEMGECCNALKKLHRHDEGIQQNAASRSRRQLVQDVAMEIGDTVVYLDLLAQRLGLRLGDCVRDTFNRISLREGFPERL